MEPRYMKNVAVSYRACPSPVLQERAFNLRTLSAPPSRQQFRSCASNISVTSSRACSAPPNCNSNIREKMLTELKFYYGKDDRFTFSRTPSPKVSTQSASNPVYTSCDNVASRQMYRSSFGNPRHRIFYRGIRIGSAKT